MNFNTFLIRPIKHCAYLLHRCTYTKQQVSFAWTYSHRIRRKYIVTKAVITKTGTKVLKTISAADVIKKLNWENQVMFGNVLRPTKSSRVSSARTVKHSPKVSIAIPTASSIRSLSLSLQDPTYYFNSHLYDIFVDELQFKAHSVCADSVPFSNFDSQNITDFPISNEWRRSYNSTEIDLGPELKPDGPKDGNLSCPSVTKILQTTMPSDAAEILEKWKKKMIASMGQEKFEAYKKRLFSQGSTFHKCLEKHLTTVDVEPSVPQDVNGYWKSVQHVLSDVDDIRYVESPVQHPFLHYKGIVDCIANYKGTLSVIEWKTAQKQKLSFKDLYDNPLQVAAYVGAINFDKHYDVQVTQGVIVIAYEDGQPAHVYILNMQRISSVWKKWLERLSLYWKVAGEKNQN